MIGDGNARDCCWYNGGFEGGLANNPGILAYEIENVDAFWLYCRHGHWPALNVRGEGVTAGRPDYDGPAFVPTGVGSVDQQRSYDAGQPGDHHLGGFNALHASGSARWHKYGESVRADWVVWSVP
jgi:hypothetical protein